MKSLNLQELILTYVGYCLKDSRYDCSAKTLCSVFQQLLNKSYQPSTIRKEISYLRKDGLLENKKYYHRAVPEITRKGRLKISTHLAYKPFGQWDGKLRVVIFNIPENDRQSRTMLRDKLKQLGFEAAQKSVYISPYPLLAPIRSFATEMGIRQHLVLMEADKIDQEKKEIQTIWNLEKINENYKKFIKNAKRKKQVRFWPLMAKKLEADFVNIYQADPRLPAEFLPKDWQGERAYKIFKEIANSY